MNTRSDWVDYAKAIGIILVVYGHIARGLFNAGINIPESTYRLADSVVYSFHMPLFFFLSGLFFYQSLSKRGSIGLTLNKIDAIVYPYLIWSILQGVVEARLSNYTNGDVAFSDVFSLWEPRAQFWFLYALFFVFVVSSIIYSFISEKYVGLVFILAGVLYLSGTVLPDVKAMSFVANNLVYFTLGMVFTKYDAAKFFSSNIALLTTMLVFILSQYLFHGYFGRLYTDKGVETLVLACVSILFVVSLSVAISKTPSRSLAYIGESSMAIYLMHILAGSGVRVILNKILSIDALAIHLVIGCLAGVLLPLLALKIINALKISYVFSAPISEWLLFLYKKALLRLSR
jgi:fucose 4-O-acetylase-like acetyltransferase